MERFSALLALCAGNSPVTGEFPSQRPVTQSFDVFFGLRLHKRLSKQSWGWWFETQSCPLWRHSNASRNLLWLFWSLLFVSWNVPIGTIGSHHSFAYLFLVSGFAFLQAIQMLVMLPSPSLPSSSTKLKKTTTQFSAAMYTYTYPKTVSQP